jgi:hypothetical protein
MTIPRHGRPDLLATAGHADHRPPATTRACDARFAAPYAVTEFAGAEGPQVREWWPVWLGASIARRYAELLAEVRAAQARPQATALAGREQAEQARGDGITWEQIGEALGLDQGPDAVSGYDLGIAAFEYFTGEPGPGYPASFQFGCASCGGYITDHGPFDSHPEGNERGHAEGCVRLAADITGWRAQQEAWQAEGGRASWAPGRRAQPWRAGPGQHARRARQRRRGRLVR